jgi:hypothetical protein
VSPTDIIRIFVASPGDVQSERDQLGQVVQELNSTLSALVPERGLMLELVRWETHARPGLGADPQDVVNRQLSIPEYDIFIGIIWRRLGTPTKRAGSGTEEEFRIAHDSWKRNRKPREILFYFCQAPVSLPETAEEAEQLLEMTRFRNELSQEGLVWEYADRPGFADLVRPHLVQVISGILRPGQNLSAAATRVEQLTPAAEVEETRRKITELAREYEKLRHDLPSSDTRTRKMEVVASRMRTLAVSAYPHISEFANSDSPGLRLAAVSTLEAVPGTDHLIWLAERLSAEKPFIGYHAALALLTAARTLEVEDLPKVRESITQARRALSDQDSDRTTVLRHAQDEVARRITESRS